MSRRGKRSGKRKWIPTWEEIIKNGEYTPPPPEKLLRKVNGRWDLCLGCFTIKDVNGKVRKIWL